MLASDRERLTQFAETLIPELRAVSGRFAPTIDFNVDDAALTIDASPFINVLIDGRGPTRPNAPRGNPTLQQIILAWIQEKGISPRPGRNGKVATVEQMSWAISKSIHLHGTLLYQRGGGNNIFDPIITKQRIDSLISLFYDGYEFEVTSTLLRQFDKK